MKKSIVVIGGGAIGTLSAYYLNKNGYNVTLLEQGTVGAGASHGNCGLILPHILPINMPGVPRMALKWFFRKDAPTLLRLRTLAGSPGWFLNFLKNCTEASMLKAADALAPLILNSVAGFDRLIEEECIDCDWQKEGTLHVYEGDDGLDAAEAEVEIERRFGIEVQRLSRTELLALEPAISNYAAGAWYYPNTAHLRPDKLMKEMKRVLIAGGVKILENTAFESFIPDGGRARGVKISDEGILEADFFILATGAWTSLYRKTMGRTLPIQPGKGYSSTFSITESPVRIPCIFVDRKTVMTPLEGCMRLGGTMEFSGYNNRLNRSRIDALTNSIAPYFPARSFGRPEEEWCGWRPMTPDGMPFIGFLSNLENVIVAAGHNTVGISMAPGTGEYVLSLVERGGPAGKENAFAVERVD